MKPVLSLRLALSLLRGQAPRAWLFVLCIALGVAARTGVGSFLASLNASLQKESRLLLGADLELSARAPLSAAQERILRRGLPKDCRYSSSVSLLTMASAQGAMGRRSKLVELSAVDAAYPLVGRLALEGKGGLKDASSLQPQPLLYAQRELLTQLDLKPGGTLRLGSLDFTVAAVLLDEPGMGAKAFSLGPRVLIGAGWARAAGLTGFGSSASYETLAALPDPGQVEILAQALRQSLGIPEGGAPRGRVLPAGRLRLRTPKNAQEDLGRFFDRLADYLGLVSLAALLLGGVGVAAVTRGFVREAAVSLGILRSLGAGPRLSVGVFAWQSLLLGLLGGLLGAAAGYFGQVLFTKALSDFLPVTLEPVWSLKPLLWGLFLGLFTALVFGLDPVLAAASQSPGSLLRDEDAPAQAWTRLAWRFSVPSWSASLAWRLGAALAFAGLAAVEAHSWLRGPGSFGALLLGAGIVQALGAWTLPRLAGLRARSLLRGKAAFPVRYALANLGRPGLRAGSSLVALGCASLLLGILAVYQHSLLKELEPARARGRMPDLFMIDVQKSQVQALRALLARLAPGARLDLSPMVKARYRGLLGEAPSPVKPAATREQEDDSAMRDREQNLSWRGDLGSGEHLVAGRWMQPQGTEIEASLEEWYAGRLGAKLGDVLRFDVQGVEVRARVTSLRRVDWASFQPNFFVLISPWALQEAPQVWIASLAKVGGENAMEDLQAAVVERFPAVTIIEVAHAAAKIQAILDKIAVAVRLVACLCLATGLMVLAGLALAQARGRRAEGALLKVLGGSRGHLLAATALEFGCLSALAAALGLGLSLLFGWVLLVKVLELDYQVPWTLLAGMGLLFTLCGAGTGLLASWQVYSGAPAEVLRQE